MKNHRAVIELHPADACPACGRTLQKWFSALECVRCGALVYAKVDGRERKAADRDARSSLVQTHAAGGSE